MNRIGILIVIGTVLLSIPIPTIIILVFLGFAFGLTNLLVIATYILAIEAVAIVTTGLTTLVVSVYRLVKDNG
ncbi:hypothetical protein [Leuconostoc mesenteroides]